MVVDEKKKKIYVNSHAVYTHTYTRAISKVRGLAAVSRCYAEGGSDLCQVVVVEVT
jgi:hypothetical protein